MKFARWVFTAAGVYGVIVILPQLFLEQRIGRDSPPAITHLEYFYGFLWVTLAWQIVFLVIGRDPMRFRALMPVAVFEKWPYAATMFTMVAQGRVRAAVIPFASVDVLLGLLFAVCYWNTAKATQDVPDEQDSRAALLHRPARGDKIRHEPVAARIQIGVPHTTQGARRVDDHAAADVNRDM